jgi:hypothetical protein
MRCRASYPRYVRSRAESVSPRQIADWRIGLAAPSHDVGSQCGLVVAGAGTFRYRIIFAIDDGGNVVPSGVVVVEGGKRGNASPEGRSTDPAIETKTFGLVLFGKFDGAGQPVARPGLADKKPFVSADEMRLFIQECAGRRMTHS